VAERYVSAAWNLRGNAEEADHLGQIYEKEGKKKEAAHFYALSLSGERPEPETRNRLAVLAGGPDKVDTEIEKYRSEQLQSRTYHVANAAKVEGKADFFILLDRGSATGATVAAVTYVSGEDKLKSMADPLKAVKFMQPFPDDSEIKILRRGTLTCKPESDCSFVLALPNDVRSID